MGRLETAKRPCSVEAALVEMFVEAAPGRKGALPLAGLLLR